MIKDHLGNVRMVLTEEIKPAGIYQATIEDGVRAFENKLFDKIPQTETDKPTTPSPGFDSNDNNAKVIKLFNVSGTDQRIGPGVVLKVMAGDKINAKVKAWYPSSATDNTVYTGAPVLINGLINALSGGLIGAGSKGTLGELSNVTGVLNTPISSFLSDPDRVYTSSKPRAYLNWVLLDEQQFKYVDIDNNSGAVQIHSIGTGEQKKLVEANGGSDITIAKNGYIYVYVSNESQGAVYFDDLRVEHTAGAILEETHYYPFGLAQQGISSKAAGTLENKKKYNGIDYENDLDLNVYDAQFRELDAQIGRWWQIDPKTEEMYMWSTYTSNFDNPIRYLDPLGDEPSNDCCGGWWKNFKTSVSDFSDKFGYLYRKNVGTPIKTGLSNLKNNWENGNLPIQQAAKGFVHEAMVNPLSLLGPAEMKGTAQALGVETKILTLEKNILKGKNFEKEAIDGLGKTGNTGVVEQLTITPKNGPNVRLDVASRNTDGTIVLTEAKGSATAPLTKNQTAGYPLIESAGGVVAGKGKPGFPSGMQIPPTKIDIVRPATLEDYLKYNNLKNNGNP